MQDISDFSDPGRPWINKNVSGYHAVWAVVWLLSENFASWQASTEAAKAVRGARRFDEEEAVSPEAGGAETGTLQAEQMVYLPSESRAKIMNTEQWRCNRSLLRASQARLSLMSFVLMLGCSFYLALGLMVSKRLDRCNLDVESLKELTGDWRSHPALAKPDGKSHRNGRVLVGAEMNKPRVLAELSRRFRAARELRFVKVGDDWQLDGEEDFETRQEYFLRLLDYYWFSKDRLTGMSRHKIESIFGPGGLPSSQRSGRLRWSAGRDILIADIENNRVIAVQYVMGF